MSSVARWDPVRDLTTLHDAMSTLMDQAVLRPGWLPFGREVGVGAVGQMNAIEADGSYYCQILLPGVTPDAVELTAQRNTLTVKATLPESFPEELRKNAVYLVHEIGVGEISRTIAFPKEIDSDKIEARFTNGVLTVVVPVAQHAQAKRIAVSASPSNEATTPLVEGEKRSTVSEATSEATR
jgi:HSP20 family protein